MLPDSQDDRDIVDFEEIEPPVEEFTGTMHTFQDSDVHLLPMK